MKKIYICICILILRCVMFTIVIVIISNYLLFANNSIFEFSNHAIFVV